MSDSLISQFRQRWLAVAAVETEESRAASTEQLWQTTNAILRLAVALGLPIDERQEQETVEVRERWTRLKEKSGG